MEPEIDESSESIKAGIFTRAVATIIDIVILGAICVPLTIVNIARWHSITVLFLITFVSLAYKPYFEFTSGSTLGKKCFYLKVRSKTLAKPTLLQVLLRNSLNIIPGLVAAGITLYLFVVVDFHGRSLESYQWWISQTISEEKKVLDTLFKWIFGLDILLLLLDGKYNRALHDWIGGTIVVKSPD